MLKMIIYKKKLKPIKKNQIIWYFLIIIIIIIIMNVIMIITGIITIIMKAIIFMSYVNFNWICFQYILVICLDLN